MIVDSHIHIFPPLSEASGYPTAAEHLAALQIAIAMHQEPPRRLRDNEPVPEAAEALNDGAIRAPQGLPASANFRAGRYGRMEWDWRGETYYKPFLPATLDDLACPPEMMAQQLQRAGVDCAIIQNSRLYGRLNDYCAAAMEAFPGKFIGLANIREHAAHTGGEIAELRRAITDLGLRGIDYNNHGHILDGYEHTLEHPRFEPFWQEVLALGVPIFWEIRGAPFPTPESYLREVDRLNTLLDRYPQLPGVFTHGFAPHLLEGSIPEPVQRILRREQLLIEILFPINWGRNHDYPYAELRPIIKHLYELVGPERLVWGSDMPLVERNCTYRQSLDYLRLALDGVASEREQDLIFGGNVLRVVGPPPAAR